ncbi:single-stranded DNA-binding protein [Photobacterium leiognathi]|uniref:single-stranded DNA-binding protein n=1 Tax=Photobacterium leiognathi TaxID=553611 RepID=UPI002980E8D4|nr:single-stranded DNA-binding protein [Photobacterium leiognathi]
MWTKLCRVGRDAELRYTASQKAVTNIVLAYDVGFGEQKRTQWIEATLWGKRAESMAQYLTKGKEVLLTGDDVETELYQKQDQSYGVKLKCVAANIEFTSDNSTQQQSNQQQYADQYSYPNQ